MAKINYTCSLGKICHSSEILKKNMHKTCSYPFDWIFSNSKMIIDCLEDNFNIFLDKSYYINISNKRCGHAYYNREIVNHYFRLNQVLFNHHNPLNNENDYNYYTRCVNRFRELLNCEESKLFIIININQDDVNEDQKNHIIEFNNKFSKYTKNYKLLFIYHIKNKPNNYHEFTHVDNIDFLVLHTLSHSNGVNFTKNNDNIYLNNIILKTYNFNVG